jgi:hypothetical protein
MSSTSKSWQKKASKQNFIVINYCEHGLAYEMINEKYIMHPYETMKISLHSFKPFYIVPIYHQQQTNTSQHKAS